MKRHYDVLSTITARELEVLHLIAYEFTCLEIADQLFLSPYTIISHKKNLMRKLGVRTIAGLVRVGCELEFIKYQKPLLIKPHHVKNLEL